MSRLLYTLVFSALILTAQSSNKVTGAASYRERMAIPPNSVFEATLEDTSRADAAADILGTIRIDNAGNPPYKFSISHYPAKIVQSHSYAARARILSNIN